MKGLSNAYLQEMAQFDAKVLVSKESSMSIVHLCSSVCAVNLVTSGVWLARTSTFFFAVCRLRLRVPFC